MTEDKCPFCGAERTLDEWLKPQYWFTCTTYQNNSDIENPYWERGRLCYEAELAALKSLVREMYKYVFYYQAISENLVLTRQALRLLNRPEVKAIMEVD